ncbi:MAG: hypothetical protein KatS3mg076_2782 [Candidatus Binatia bacterium]|nr:MAG: hypothetical protein KatS3mg076_2782 [Candidatus Binatia bacterium]
MRSRVLGGILWLFVVPACAPRALRIHLPEGSYVSTTLVRERAARPAENITREVLGRTGHLGYQLVHVRSREERHFHARQDLVVVLLSGSGVLWMEGERLRMDPGDVAVVPAGKEHFFVNTGDEPASAFVVSAPPLEAPDVVPVRPRP